MGMESDGGGGWYRRFYHADHQGSIVAVAGNYGERIAVKAYDAWGVPNPANQGRFGYTGQMWLPELGMWYYKARIYASRMGRFLQTDPVGYEDQLNLYSYAHNDPINGVDPDGLGCETRTGSHICEETATRAMSVQKGDETRFYVVTYFKSDGLITNISRASEGVGDSDSDVFSLEL